MPFKSNLNNNNSKQEKVKNKTINYQKKINLSQAPKQRKEKEKLTMEKIRQKIEELNQQIKYARNNNYYTNLNNKMKTSIAKNNVQCNKTNNKNISWKRKLCLYNSFLTKPKPKMVEKNNSKKFFILKK